MYPNKVLWKGFFVIDIVVERKEILLIKIDKYLE
jgi:hypothetical protein